MKNRLNNVPDPAAFQQQLDRTFNEIFALIHLVREQPLRARDNASESESEAETSADELTAYEVTQQLSRPAEYLQSLLDLIRIIHEPSPPGTWLLNANFGFLLEEIRTQPFRLGYLSVIGLPGETPAQLHERAVEPKLLECGYDLAQAHATFVMVTASPCRLRLPLIGQVNRQYRAGFGVDDVMERMASAIQGTNTTPEPAGRTYAGFSQDEALGPDRLRLSMWLFLPSSDA